MPYRFAHSAARIDAIAALAFRAAARSRLLLCMAALLLLVTFGLPLVIVGDGTLTGWVHVLLDYALGLSALALSIAMLWTSCAGVSRDIEQGHIRLVAVRPVYRLELWLGKWLGLLALSAILLTITGVGTYALLQWHLHRPGTDQDELHAVNAQVLLGQRRVLPGNDTIAEDAEQRLSELAAQGRWHAETISRFKALEFIARQLRAEWACVEPGATRTWSLAIPNDMPPAAPVTLRVRISSLSGENSPLSGRWTLTRMATPDQPWPFLLTNYSHGMARLTVPPEYASPGQTLRVDYINTPGPQSGAVIFDIDHGVELLITEGGFAGNLMRSLVVVWCRIGLLCAFGLAAGTCFSFPVAAFVSSSVVLLSLTGHYFITSDWIGAELRASQGASAASIMQQWSEPVIRALERIAAPAISQSPIAMLSDGILVSWSQASTSAALLLGIYAGVLALLSAWILHRRELG